MKRARRRSEPFFMSNEYDPTIVGSIVGSSEGYHDGGLERASKSNYDGKTARRCPLRNQEPDPKLSIFIFNLPAQATAEDVRKTFEKYGCVDYVRLVKDIVTGESKRYAFLSFQRPKDMLNCFWRTSSGVLMKDGEGHCTVNVDFERERLMEGWKPRRTGGGLGGRKESGQMRFGSRKRPFKVYDSSKKHVTSKLDRHPLPVSLNHEKRRKSDNYSQTR